MKARALTAFVCLALAFTCAQRPTIASPPGPGPTPTANPCAGLLAELNRPTVGYSPCAAERGSVVLELGYQHENAGTPSHATSQTQIGQGFLRYGLARRFELDVIGPNIVVQRGAQDANGLADSGLGFKYEIAPAARWELGVDGLYTSPNGAATFTAGSATYTANFDAAYQLTPATSLGTTLSLASTGGFGAGGMHARYGTFTPSALVLEQIGSAAQAYVEYVDVSRVSPNIGNRAFIDAGVQRLLGECLEIDVEYGDALTGDPSLRFNYVGAGIGILLGP